MTNEQIKIKADEALNEYVPRGGAYKKFENIIAAKNIKLRTIAAKDNFLGIFTQNRSFTVDSIV